MGSSRVLRFTTVDPRFAFLSRKSGGAHDENPRFDHISLAADRLIPKPKSLTMKFSNSALILALATTTEAFAAPAHRPKYSKLDATKWEVETGLKSKSWELGLQQCLEELES